VSERWAVARTAPSGGDPPRPHPASAKPTASDPASHPAVARRVGSANLERGNRFAAR
jgi:hypothetical protein